MRSSVVLPDPDGPSSTRYSPSSVAISMPSTAGVSPTKTLRTPLVSTTAMCGFLQSSQALPPTRPCLRHFAKIVLTCVSALATACLGGVPLAAAAIMFGRTKVLRTSPSAALDGPGYPTLVLHDSASLSSASLLAGCDLKGSLSSQPGSCCHAAEVLKAGKS